MGVQDKWAQLDPDEIVIIYIWPGFDRKCILAESDDEYTSNLDVYPWAYATPVPGILTYPWEPQSIQIECRKLNLQVDKAIDRQLGVPTWRDLIDDTGGFRLWLSDVGSSKVRTVPDFDSDHNVEIFANQFFATLYCLAMFEVEVRGGPWALFVL